MHKKDWDLFIEIMERYSDFSHDSDSDEEAITSFKEVREVKKILQGSIVVLDEYLDLEKNIPFKKGSVGFVKKIGDVLVNSARIGPVGNEVKVKEYVVVDADAQDHNVTPKELLPSTSATKVLYSKTEKE
jgi:hypothetical protein